MINPLSIPVVTFPFVQPTRSSVPRKLTVGIRWLIGDDYSSVLDIEQRTEAFSPWNRSEFLTKLRDRSTIGNVAMLGNRVIGFAVYRLNSDHIDVLKLAVSPAFQRASIASQMVARLKGKLESPGRRAYLSACVRERDLSSQLFLKASGFRWTSTVEEAFPGDPPSDGYKLEYRRPEDPGRTITLYASQDDGELGEGNCPEMVP